MGVRSLAIRNIEVVFSHDGAAYPAWKAVDISKQLGISGRVLRGVVRMDAAGNATSCDYRLLHGADHSGVVSTPANAANVPDERVAAESTAIALAGSATTADEDLNYALDTDGAPYDISPNGASGVLAVRFIAGAVGNTTLTVTLVVEHRG